MPRRFTTPVLLPGDPTGALEAAPKQYVDPKADDSAVVHNTGTETIGGAKTFSVAPQVPVGNLLAHPVRRDDARLTDARTPTAHELSHAIGGSDPLSPADIGAAPTANPSFTGVVATTTTNFYDLQESHRQAGDTANRHEVFGDGYMKWGPGNAGPDTFFYRNAAAQLRTNGGLVVDGAVAAAAGSTVGGVEVRNVGDVIGGIRSARITADQVVSASTTLVNSTLAFSVTAGGVYELTGLLFMVGATAGDFIISFSGPTMSVFSGTVTGLVISATASSGSFIQDGMTTVGATVARGASGSNDFLPVTAYFIPSASGTVTLRFAQNAASGTSTLKAGSFMRCWRIG